MKWFAGIVKCYVYVYMHMRTYTPMQII